MIPNSGLQREFVLQKGAQLKVEFPLVSDTGSPRSYEIRLSNTRLPGSIRFGNQTRTGSNVQKQGTEALIIRTLPQGSWTIHATIEGKSFTDSITLETGETVTLAFD